MTLVRFRAGDRRGPALARVLAVATLLSSGTAFTQDAPPTAECCSHDEDRDPYGLIWTGHQEVMPIEQLAA